MICVRIRYHEGSVSHIDVTGHSGYEDSGKDIVCAGISALTIALINGMTEVLHYQEKDILEEHSAGITRINVPLLEKEEDAKKQNGLNVLLQTYLLNVRLIEGTYGDFVKVVDVNDKRTID
jgi:uncharacterized protein YsxB (DUF464 family)